VPNVIDDLSFSVRKVAPELQPQSVNSPDLGKGLCALLSVSFEMAAFLSAVTGGRSLVQSSGGRVDFPSESLFCFKGQTRNLAAKDHGEQIGWNLKRNQTSFLTEAE
jgi:hypothetical protein